MKSAQTFTIALVAMLFVWGAARAGEITVTGEGRTEVRPDMATLTLSVTQEGRTAEAAVDAMSEDAQALLETIRQSGVADRDVQSSSLRLSPVWSRRERDDEGAARIVGYTASTDFQVRLRDLAKLGPFLDQAVRDGSNAFGGVFFGLQDPGPHLDAARRAAVKDAIWRAQVFARAAEQELGEILSMVETVAGGDHVLIEARSLADTSVPTSAGEVSVEAAITVVFELVKN